MLPMIASRRERSICDADKTARARSLTRSSDLQVARISSLVGLRFDKDRNADLTGLTDMGADDVERLPDDQIENRRDSALLRALSTPHKRQKEMKLGTKMKSDASQKKQGKPSKITVVNS
jgi:hypothetical protein